MNQNDFKKYENHLLLPQKQLEEGFIKNAIVYRCISEIARCAAELDFEVVDNEDEYTEEESLAYTLIENPNNYQSTSEFLEAALIHYLATGSTYIEAITNLSGTQIIELHVIPSHEMTIQTQPSPSPYHAHKYTWNNETGTKQWLVNPVTGSIESYKANSKLSSKLLHFKKYHPLLPKEGLSPLRAGGASADLSNNSLIWNNSLLENMGRPPGIFKTLQTVSDALWNRLKELISQFSGKHNAGKVPILEGGLEWQATGINPTDMDFINGLNQADKYIGSVFGVPVDLILGSATFNNSDVARENLYLNTIIPLANTFLSKLAKFIEPQSTTSLRVNEEDIPALEPMRTRKYNRLLQARKNNILTVNEIREELGWDASPDQEADELFGMSLGAVDSPANVDEIARLNNETR